MKTLTLAQSLIVFLFFLIFNHTYSQNPYNGKHYDHWAFGRQIEVDFTSGSPILVGCSLPMTASEGCAAYSDPTTGNFIAYTNGQQVWQAGSNVVLNGGGALIGNSSSIESGMILPKPGGTVGQFFIFHNNTIQAYYSEADMAIGPNGTVTSSNILLSNTSAERFGTVPHANGVDYWVLCNQNMNDTILAFLVNSSGVSSTPVKSATGVVGGNRRGNFTLTSDYQTIGMSVESKGMYLYDFDNCTGMASNMQKIGTTTNGFGSCFSQDDTKLYYTNGYGQALYQYDLLTSTETLIDNGQWSYPVLAPDGKIYVSKYGATSLAVINLPNASGVACNFVANGFSLGTCIMNWGLPKPFYLSGIFTGPTTPANVSICAGDTTVLTASAGTSYNWSTGDTTNTISVFLAGTYTVQIQHGTCSVSQDTFVVNVLPVPISTNTTSICDGDSLFIAGAFQTLAGTYNDTLTNAAANGCDSIIQTTLSLKALPVSMNTVNICEGDSMYVAGAFQTLAGIYIDTLSNAGANGCDSIIQTTLSIDDCDTLLPSSLIIPNVFTPNGDGSNDEFTVISTNLKSIDCVIYNRWGQLLYSWDTLGGLWDGDDAPDGTYFYIINAEGLDGEEYHQNGTFSLIR